MIYENNCLFLFRKDLPKDLRNKIDISSIDLKYFYQSNSVYAKIKELIDKASLIAFIETKERLVKFLSGPLKGHIDKY
jgi:hypothetical protein